jgi:hypothetical protein
MTEGHRTALTLFRSITMIPYAEQDNYNGEYRSGALTDGFEASSNWRMIGEQTGF